jgi:hypothetical protein
LELDTASGAQRLVDAQQGLPANRVLMLVPFDNGLICVGVRHFSDDLNVSPPKVVFAFDPDTRRSQALAGSQIQAPGFPNRNVRHLEIVDLSPDPARGGLWATMLVNNRFTGTAPSGESPADNGWPDWGDQGLSKRARGCNQ